MEPPIEPPGWDDEEGYREWLAKQVECPQCRGTGTIQEHHGVYAVETLTCPQCLGRGTVTINPIAVSKEEHDAIVEAMIQGRIERNEG
jgi:DnaJ-class molecular chaperone